MHGQALLKIMINGFDIVWMSTGHELRVRIQKQAVYGRRLISDSDKTSE